MSRYLSALLAQAAGATAQLRLRPKTRFEGNRGGLSFEELPSFPPAVSRGGDDPAPPPVRPLAGTPPGTAMVRSASASYESAGPTPPLTTHEIHYETLRERIETSHHSERLIERQDRVTEHRERLDRIERVESEVEAAAGPHPNAPPTEKSAQRNSGIVVMIAAAPPSAAPQLTMVPPRRGAIVTPAAPSAPAATSDSPAKDEPEIIVSIGRLDIRLTQAVDPAPRTAKQAVVRGAAESALPLAEYLLRRERGAS